MKQKTHNRRALFASRFMIQESGFSLLELLIVIAIVGLLAAGVGVSLVNYQRTAALDSSAKEIVGNLRFAQSKAITGEDGNADSTSDKWGVRFTNGTNDTYRIFYGNSYNVNNAKEEIYLPSSVSFSAPAEENNLDVIFTKISGTTTATAVTIANANGSETRTITVDASGRINTN